MFRMSKLTDYSTIVLGIMAKQPDTVLPTNSIVHMTHLPQPTVSKILKLLTKAGLLRSIRGTQGGYRLSHAPEAISIADVVQALEGPWAVTECSHRELHSCHIERTCEFRGHWQFISGILYSALANITLADLTATLNPLQLYIPKPNSRIPKGLQSATSTTS